MNLINNSVIIRITIISCFIFNDVYQGGGGVGVFLILSFCDPNTCNQSITQAFGDNKTIRKCLLYAFDNVQIYDIYDDYVKEFLTYLKEQYNTPDKTTLVNFCNEQNSHFHDKCYTQLINKLNSSDVDFNTFIINLMFHNSYTLDIGQIDVDFVSLYRYHLKINITKPLKQVPLFGSIQRWCDINYGVQDLNLDLTFYINNCITSITEAFGNNINLGSCMKHIFQTPVVPLSDRCDEAYFYYLTQRYNAYNYDENTKYSYEEFCAIKYPSKVSQCRNYIKNVFTHYNIPNRQTFIMNLMFYNKYIFHSSVANAFDLNKIHNMCDRNQIQKYIEAKKEAGLYIGYLHNNDDYVERYKQFLSTKPLHPLNQEMCDTGPYSTPFIMSWCNLNVMDIMNIEDIYNWRYR